MSFFDDDKKKGISQYRHKPNGARKRRLLIKERAGKRPPLTLPEEVDYIDLNDYTAESEMPEGWITAYVHTIDNMPPFYKVLIPEDFERWLEAVKREGIIGETPSGGKKHIPYPQIESINTRGGE